MWSTTSSSFDASPSDGRQAQAAASHPATRWRRGARRGILRGPAIISDFRLSVRIPDVLSMSAPDNRNMVLFPEKIVGMCKQPLLAPEAPYEVDGGFRNNVIFPGGMILEDDGEVKLYYGAADTVTCLATADVGELVGLCEAVRGCD
jgi:predicted GH43/DUF377 family glycosyl hydrolase